MGFLGKVAAVNVARKHAVPDITSAQIALLGARKMLATNPNEDLVRGIIVQLEGACAQFTGYVESPVAKIMGKSICLFEWMVVCRQLRETCALLAICYAAVKEENRALAALKTADKAKIEEATCIELPVNLLMSDRWYMDLAGVVISQGLVLGNIILDIGSAVECFTKEHSYYESIDRSTITRMLKTKGSTDFASIINGK